MKARNGVGATLAFTAAIALVIVLIGVFIFFMLQMFGGVRELQHATDAGNLNVAKEGLVSPNYQVNQSYQMDFAGLVDPEVNAMDLQVYNRAFGQAFLVALNAAADRPQSAVSSAPSSSGTPSSAGIAHAKQVIQAATGGDGTNVGVGEQLYQLFTLAGNNSGQFTALAASNSIRMLSGTINDDNASAAVAFLDPSGPTNVYIDVSPSNAQNTNNTTSVLPITSDTGNNYSSGTNAFTSNPVTLSIPATSITNSSNQYKSNTSYSYLPGYYNVLSSLTNAPAGATLTGVPVFPDTQPHHIAGRDFYSTDAQQNALNFPAMVPPNAFKSVASGATTKTSSQLQTEAYSLAGTSTDYELSIPNGYIEIYNPPGLDSPTYTMVNNVLTSELTTGIYLASTYNNYYGEDSSGVAFTTDQSVLEQWQSYNASPNAGANSSSAPPLYDDNGDPYLFFTNQEAAGPDNAYTHYGDVPLTILPVSQSPCSNGGASFDGGPCETVCYWTNITGSQSNATCAALLPYFVAAYPTEYTYTVQGGTQLTAVEYLKSMIIKHFLDGWELMEYGSYNGDTFWSSGTDGWNNANTAALCGDISCPSSSMLPGYPGYTGLRYWDTSGYSGNNTQYEDQAGGHTWSASYGSQTGYAVTHSGTPSPIHQFQTGSISAPGTLTQLFSEVFNWPANSSGAPTPEPNSIISQIAQRMHQINPSGTSVSAAVSLLQGMPQTFDLGTTSYLYFNSSASSWVITNGSTGYTYSSGTWTAGSPALPPGLNGGSPPSPDGSLQVWTSDQIGSLATGIGGYQTQATMVNPPHEADIYDQLYSEVNSVVIDSTMSGYEGYSDTSAAYESQRGVDVIDWQPSSGYSNLLGTLSFQNYCGGSLVYSSNQSTYAASNYCEPN